MLHIGKTTTLDWGMSTKTQFFIVKFTDPLYLCIYNA